MAINDIQNELQNLLDRPHEPILIPKGDNGVVFNLPDNYLEDRFKNADVVNRFGGGGKGNRIEISSVTIPESLRFPRQLPEDEIFSLFIPHHRQMAGKLIEVLMGLQNYNDFKSVIAYCREAGRINSSMLNYAVNVAVLNRPDTKGVQLQPLCELFPAKFMDGRILRKARVEANLSSSGGIVSEPLVIPKDYSASDLDIEHRLAYFREDLGINLHHWHWHLVYPNAGPVSIIRKDRRGELFYYMHQQILARYNFERLSNKLARVTRLMNLREPIAEGYFPKLDSLASGRIWASRTPNTTLKDINRESEQIAVDILDLERWRDRLHEVAQTGRVIDSKGATVMLNEQDGIDILGNLVESSELSLNRNVYGDLHNLGHLAISFCHDPDGRHLEPVNAMGESTTSMRDPVFYRWHAFVDDIFQDYKKTLQPYTIEQLGFNQVEVTGLEVKSEDAELNTFSTYWQNSDVNLSRGLDFAPRVPVYARFTHLQHAPFEYTIKINNKGPARKGTVRIFMAPRFDERGLPFLFNKQRHLMIELDKFTEDLKPNQNEIKRKSTQSSVTIPFERTFRNLEIDTTSPEDLAAFNYCGCGWPQHMLIPKGSAEGFDAVLFVMVTNYEEDKVGDKTKTTPCQKAISYCGVQDAKYPDRKPMGFPFDRQPPLTGRMVDDLQSFLTPNMRIQNVKIVFSNQIKSRSGNAAGQTSAPIQTGIPEVIVMT